MVTSHTKVGEAGQVFTGHPRRDGGGARDEVSPGGGLLFLDVSAGYTGCKVYQFVCLWYMHISRYIVIVIQLYIVL